MRTSLIVLDSLLAVLFVARLIALKRTVEAYRPPAPLPPFRRAAPSLTITRWT